MIQIDGLAEVVLNVRDEDARSRSTAVCWGSNG